MKILFIDYDDLNNPYAGGGQAYMTRELTKRLSVNHNITIVTGKYPQARNLTYGNLHYFRLGIGNLGYMVSLISHWLLIPIYVLFYQHSYDVIIECFTAPFTTSFVPMFARKPLIALPTFFDSAQLAKKYHLPLDIFQNLLIRKYNHFICMTEVLKRRIHSIHPKAYIKIIPGGTDIELFKSKNIHGEYVLYIGRIDIYNKGLRLLVEAWKNFNTKLIIAGSGNKKELETLVKLISDNHLQKNILMIGKVDGKQKIDLYRKSLFVVQPSIYETFGFTALETLASGKLLVCFDIEGFKWIPSKYAIKIKSINTKSLILGLKHALRSVKAKNNICRINRDFASKFSWDNVSVIFEKELHHLWT
jgi:glycosyltransferase involved in cell wall biosynthesis